MKAVPKSLLETSLEYDLDSPSVIEGEYKRRILTGMRPTGLLHLGHYKGALENWLKLQDEFHCNFLIADLHALADHPDDPNFVKENIIEVVTDWLAVGINPDDNNIFVQTGIPELGELTVLIQTLFGFNELMRNPTLKSEIRDLDESNKGTTVSFATYPVSQAADIIGPLGDLVPAGDDQKPMIETVRTISRRFNRIYGDKTGFKLPIPQMLKSDFGRLVGTDGSTKMSKTRGNVIGFSNTNKEIEKIVNKMPSSGKSISDPGTTEDHLVFTYLDAFYPNKDELKELKKAYRKGGIGEGEVKSYLKRCLVEFIMPIRERRLDLSNNKNYVIDVIHEGTKKTRVEVQEVLSHIREAMGLFTFTE